MVVYAYDPQHLGSWGRKIAKSSKDSQGCIARLSTNKKFCLNLLGTGPFRFALYQPVRNMSICYHNWSFITACRNSTSCRLNFWFLVLRIEHRALYIQGKHYTTETKSALEIFFYIYLLLFYIHLYFACRYVCVSVRSWGYRQCWVACGCWDFEPAFLEEQSVPFTAEPSFQPPKYFF